jgi:hypothetical protein
LLCGELGDLPVSYTLFLVSIALYSAYFHLESVPR